MTALVTGGTSGIGAAVVRRLAADGYQVVFCGRRETPGHDLEKELRSEGHEALFVVCDVSRESEVEALVAKTKDWGKSLDVAVNCAGISPKRARLTESTVDAYEQVFSANVLGTFLSMKHEMKVMEGARSGVIVNLSSVLGIKAVNLNHSLYTASKHAVIGLTKTAALEGAPFGVRVNAVCPGVIDTPIHATNAPSPEARQAMVSLHPLGRLGTVEEVAASITWLVSPQATFVTGCIFSVDGGATL